MPQLRTLNEKISTVALEITKSALLRALLRANTKFPMKALFLEIFFNDWEIQKKVHYLSIFFCDRYKIFFSKLH